jgi:hypothetical protein
MHISEKVFWGDLDAYFSKLVLQLSFQALLTCPFCFIIKKNSVLFHASKTNIKKLLSEDEFEEDFPASLRKKQSGKSRE